jgi:predicted nucleotidyltransferase component of viral defense system
MELKIIDKLKKRSHKDLALAHDILIDIIYEVFPNAIFHGGTAVWRCYNGSRFSDDIDVYLKKEDSKKLDLFKEKLKERKIEIIKFKSTGKDIYSKLSLSSVEVRFEASLLDIKGKEPIVRPYETLEGNYINVFTFSPEDLIKEKVDTYLSRYLARDIYDIYILLNAVERPEKIAASLRRLISNYKEPKDEDILSSLVFIGAVPTTKQMLDYIKKWAK